MPQVEQAFAVKAIKHADSYFNLCKGVKASTIALTLHTEAPALLESFKAEFPHLFENDGARLKKLDEEKDVKSQANKEKWRAWIKPWETRIDDFNFGTLLRSDCKDEYVEQNSMFGGCCMLESSLSNIQRLGYAVTRIQFLAVEIARCSMGMNDWIYEEVSIMLVLCIISS